MRLMSFGIVMLAMTVAAGAQVKPKKADDKIAKQPVTLTGCVTAGTAHNTYMLTDVQRTDVAVGTSGAPDTAAVYWLNQPDKFKSHVGHKVEIVGMLDDDVDKTKVKTKDGKVELKTERTKKVEVPEGSAAAASATAAAPGEIKVPSFKVKVQSVRLLADTCS